MEVHDGGLAEEFWCPILIVASRFNWQNVGQLQTLFIVVNELGAICNVAVNFEDVAYYQNVVVQSKGMHCLPMLVVRI